MNDSGHSQNSINIPRCIQQLDRSSAVMVVAPETNILPFWLHLVEAKVKMISF